MTERELAGLVRSLSLGDKAVLCSGATAWETQAIPARGIPALRMADGPHGLRVEDRRNRRRQNGSTNKPATCFPPEVTLAGAFSPALTRRVGQAIAEECLACGVGVLLGPGVNIKRSPLGGRNFEYYSEDPLLAGELAAGFISGVQGVGVGTSLKHYAVNNQERYRMSISAAVDERALFDIYLRPFEIAVRKAQPDTVMASYNRVNGVYATQHRRLLTEILRLHFGFRGLVMSDWGAVYERPAALAAGMDLEMPYSGAPNTEAIVRAVETGALSEDDVDTAVWNVLRLVFARSRQGRPAPPCNWAAHHALAREAACQSAVLLKNEAAGDGAPMLPLSPGDGRVAVIGQMAEKPRYQGGGSSVINPTKLVSFLSAMKAAGHPFVYAPGYEGDTSGEAKTAAAVAAAKSCRRVVLFLGLPDAYECEGYDRSHLRLPETQLRLLRAVAEANPNLCVVLSCGGPVDTAWLPEARALLCLHLGGQAQGEAAVKLLYGEANPGGKLAETWPAALEDCPASTHFPMGPEEVSYNESIYVGYRYYDSAQKQVAFPFGYGLSYTKFAFSALELDKATLAEGESLGASFTVKNTGDRNGAEVAQLYLRRKASAAHQPRQELVGFARVELAAGAAARVTVSVPWDHLAFYDEAAARRVVEAGEYELHVGASSRDLRLAAAFAAQGVQVTPKPGQGADGPYGQIKDNRFEDFDAIYGGRHLDNALPRKGRYTALTPLGLMDESPAGRTLLRLSRLIARHSIRFSTSREANQKAIRHTTHDLPFKNIVLNTSGIVGHRAAATLLELCNGRGGFFRFVGDLLARR